MNLLQLSGDVRELRRRLNELAGRVSVSEERPAALDSGDGATVDIETSLPITGGPILRDGTIGHAASGVGAGTYTKATVTVDATGHVTGASSGAAEYVDGSASLDFATLAAGAAEEKTVAVTGAAAGDPVSLGVPNALAAHNTSSSFFAWVSAAGVVTVRRSVVAADGGDPAAATVKVRVHR